MKAFVLEYGKLLLKEMPDPKPNKGEVVVKLKVAGLNRRDLYIPNRMGPDKEALILGSDGAGIVEEVGEGVKTFNVGDEVIINPSLGWFENSAAPPEGYEILGMPDHGTQTWCNVPTSVPRASSACTSTAGRACATDTTVISTKSRRPLHKPAPVLRGRSMLRISSISSST